MSFLSPHYPLQPDPGFEALYHGVDISLRDNVRAPSQVFTPTYSPESPQPIETDPNFHRYGASIERFWQFYAAMVSQLDHEVGRILAELRSQGRHDETLVVFTSDHGEMGGSHGEMNKGRWQEESTRVPMIVRAPGAPIGATVDTPVSAGVDILPTALDWVGAGPEPTASGASFLPMVEAGTARPHHPVFSEMAGGNDWVMVRDGDWKYVAGRETGDPIALHDLAHDPHELANLVDADPEHDAGVKRRELRRCARGLAGLRRPRPALRRVARGTVARAHGARDATSAGVEDPGTQATEAGELRRRRRRRASARRRRGHRRPPR